MCVSHFKLALLYNPRYIIEFTLFNSLHLHIIIFIITDDTTISMSNDFIII